MTALASTLVHFLWQGTIGALLLAGGNLLLRRAGPRYAAACATLAAMLAVSGATYAELARRTTAAKTGIPTASSAAPAIRATPVARAISERLTVRIPRLPPPAERVVVLCWLAGVAALSARLLGGWAAVARQARRSVAAVPDVWQARLPRLAARLSVHRPVRLLTSALVEAPAALGILRPVILLPASAFTALTAAELEAILAHELAHIRRHDFLVNLLQSAAETLLFYHPAVWWVSHRIRVERENACDDLAVAATGDAALYARALVGLEETRTSAPRLAAAATGGSLLRRVARLFPGKPPAADRLPPSIAAVLALVAIALIGAAAHVTPLTPEPAAAFWGAVPDAVPEPRATPRPAVAAPAAKPKPKPAKAASAEPAAPAKETEPKDAGGPPRLTTGQLIAFRIHGVTPEFVEEVRALGFQGLSADELVSMRIHGVTPEFVREIRAEELGDLDVEKLLSFRIHGVTPEFVREVRALGYSGASGDDLVAMRIHGVTPDDIRKMNRKFGRKLSVDDLVGARIHGIKGDDR